MTSIEVKEQALKLSVEERLELATTLWDSVDREADELPLTDEHKRILDERLAAAERHPDGWLDWDEAKERVLASLRRRPGA
jgi:putative addiction module component (TIGR02574 family)